MQPTAVLRTTIAEPTSLAGSAQPVVLVVTNDRDLREVAARVLGQEGYRVLTAAHGGHAVLQSLQTHVDVAAIELSMEDVSGPALAERLRRQNPDLRTIYLAKTGTPECEGVLVRPFTRDDLLEELALAGCGV
jgi:CheY-like chemotaxis protein